MAYAVDPFSDQRRKDAAAQSAAIGAGGVGTTSSPGSGTVTGAPATQPTPGTGGDPNAGTSGTGFINLNQYVQNNQQASGQMANKLTNSAQSQADKAQQDLGNLQSQYQVQVQNQNYDSYTPTAKGTAFPIDPTVANQLGLNPDGTPKAAPATGAPVSATSGNGTTGTTPTASATAGNGTTGTTPATPTATGGIADTSGFQGAVQQAIQTGTANQSIRQAADPADVAAMQAVAGRSYQGPNSLADLSGFQGAQQDTARAQNTLAGLHNPYAVGAMLGDQYGLNYGGGAGGGNEDLDSFLTSQAGAKQFDDLSQKYSGLTDTLQQATADTSAADAVKEHDAAATAQAQAWLAGEDANTKARTDLQGKIDAQKAQDAQNAQDAKDYQKYQDYWMSYSRSLHPYLPFGLATGSDDTYGKEGMTYSDWMDWRNSVDAPSSISTINRKSSTNP